MSKDFRPEPVTGMSLIPPLRNYRIFARKQRKPGRANRTTGPKKPMYQATDQVQFEFPYTDSPRPRVIKTGLPIVPYLPKDPGRRERLLAANAEINRARTEASRSGHGRLYHGSGKTGGGMGH